MGMSCPTAIIKKLQKCIFVLFWSFLYCKLQFVVRKEAVGGVY